MSIALPLAPPTAQRLPRSIGAVIGELTVHPVDRAAGTAKGVIRSVRRHRGDEIAIELLRRFPPVAHPLFVATRSTAGRRCGCRRST
jgi:hypothetical protein